MVYWNQMPFTLWNLTPEKACSDPRFYCRIVNGNPALKRVHLFQGHLGWAGLKWCCLQYSFKKRLVKSHLIFSSFLPSTFSAKISDYSSEISASDSCKLCRSASFGSTPAHLTPVVFTIFGFPRIRFLFNFILFWILGIRYGLCTGHLNTDRGEAARFQKLPTTIKRQYNTILPKSSSLKWKEQTIVCFCP